MSDNRKFGPIGDSEKTPEERLGELERLWPLIQAKIQSYDQILNEFQNIKADLAALKDQVADRKLDCQQLNQNHSYHINTCDKRFADVGTQIANLNPKIDAAMASTEIQGRQINDQINEAKSSVTNLKQNFQEVFATVAKKTELDTLKDYIEKNHSAFFAALDGAKTLSIDANFNIASAHDRIDNVKNGIAESTKKVASNSDQITAMLHAFESFKQYSSSQIVAESAKVKKDIEDKMAALKTEVSGSPASLETLKKDLLKKMEGIALDGSNAVLKATNSASQIVILEKKIENIYLLLKKLELSK